MTTISAVRIPAISTHTATIIFAHGLGDTGSGWTFLAEQFRQHQSRQHIAYVFPNAPSIPITLNAGMKMPGWYDMLALEIDAEEDDAGILKSASLIHQLVSEEVDRGIGSDRVIVGGFSQGGAVSLLAGLTCERKLGGIIALSTYLPLHRKFPAMRADRNAKTEVFQGHGTADPVVQCRFGEMTREKLKAMKQPVDWHEYPMGHTASMEEINTLCEWVGKILPPL